LAAQYTTSWVDAGGLGSATGNVTTSGSITSGTLSSFGAMSIASTLQVVPLYFLSIKAVRFSEYTTIEWKTTSEENVAWHEIQKSTSAHNFVTIGRSPARNLTAQTYQFNDSAYLNGFAYYRIKSIDRDGKTKYSTIVSVSDKAGNELILLTNPVKDRIQLSGGKDNASYEYGLFSSDGRLVQKGTIRGSNLLAIGVSETTTPGAYILTVNSNTQHLTKKIIVQ
jgi:hypothetical protein